MLFGVCLLYACFGMTVAALAPLVGPISEDLGLSRSAMGWVLGAWPLVYIASAMPCGAVLDRFGLRRSLFLAACIMALSGALRAEAGGHLELFLAVALFGLGGPLVSVGAPKLISQWFSGAERGTAMGLYITGVALGGILSLALTNSTIMPLVGNDWRAVLRIYAAITLAAGVIWLLISGHPVSRASEQAAAAAGKPGQLAVFGALLRVPAVRLVLLMSVGIFFFNHGLNNWLPEILRAGGMDPVAAGYWAAIPTAVGLVGALTIPRLATSARQLRVLLVLFACAGFATLLIHAGSGPVLAAGLIFQGVARSAMMPVAILVLMDCPGVASENMGAAGGLFFSAAEIGGVLGPLTIGIVADTSAGFAAALGLLTGVCVGLLGLLAALRASHRAAARVA
jgi:cyanate permease